MYSLLLRKALPFALTFIIGSLVGGLFKAVGFGGQNADRGRSYFHGSGGRHSSCRMRASRRYLVAETKPLAITFKPDAHRPHELRGTDKESIESLPALVTFGEDGKVRDVRPTAAWSDVNMWGVINANGVTELKAVTRAVEAAARQIQFEPETVNGLPVTVTREVEIHFMGD